MNARPATFKKIIEEKLFFSFATFKKKDTLTSLQDQQPS
jgi:hypothetical protein